MNYGNLPMKARLDSFTSRKPEQLRHISIIIFKSFFILALISLAIGAFTGIGMIHGILDSAPDISSLNVESPSHITYVYDSHDNIIQTLANDDSIQEDVSYQSIPKDLIQSFIIIEDPSFFYHNGIDLKGLLKALMIDLTTGEFSENASTITQQLIKNTIFNKRLEQNFGETIERKFQEQYLALQLEKRLDKNTILEYYLNSINLGSNTLGVQAASKRYFNKNVSDLNLSECTVLAAIAQNPSAYNPIKHPEQNEVRRKAVLDIMLNNRLITQGDYIAALNDDVYSRIQTVPQTSYKPFSYYMDEVFNTVLDDLQKKLGYTETQAYNLLYNGGLSIYTTMDHDIQAIADEEINSMENYPINDFSMNYSLTIRRPDGTTNTYNETDITNYEKNVRSKPAYKNIFSDEKDMQTSINEFKAYTLQDGDEILSEIVNKIPQPQASMVIMDQTNGHVLALCGGRGEKTGSLTFNRATDAIRQPGSCFQILTSFAPALDVSGAALATPYYDSPYMADGQTFVNWWNEQYMGYSNIRQGIKYSMNIVSAKCLNQLVSPVIGYDYAANFGISSLVNQDKEASLAIGNVTNGVTNLDLTSAYATIANKGVYNKPVFYTKVLDHSGKTILSEPSESHSVLKESTASLLTMAMADSVSGNDAWSEYGIHPTGALCQVKNMSIAGSAGFTADSNDVWFMGYSPYITCGIWSGYDESKPLDSKDYHKQIWQKVMSKIHAGKLNKDFPISSELEQEKICSKSGLLAVEGICDHQDSNSIVYDEFFENGTAPKNYCDRHFKVNICMESGEQAAESCPKDQIKEKIYFTIAPLESAAGVTNDSSYTAPPNLLQSVCSLHRPANLPPPPSSQSNR